MTNDIRTPFAGSIHNPVKDTERHGVMVWRGEMADPKETQALVIPQTRESRDQLYDRLVLAFAGRADRYELAHTALAAIGVEVTAARAVAA